MLTHLAIRNLALIDTLELAPESGFTVLTGETGAGKSMLLDALDLALGGRAEAGLIRAGAPSCDITAEFAIGTNPAIHALLEEQGVEVEDTLTLRRQVKREGDKTTSRAWVGGTAVAVGVLTQLAEHLVDIHSQHGTLALTTPAAQRNVVDAFAGNAPLLQTTATSFAAWQQAQNALDAARTAAARATADADLRQAWIAELAALNYQPGEEETLARQRARCANFAQLQQLLAAADAALNDEQGALQSLGLAARNLTSAATLDETLAPLATRVDAALEDLRDAAYDIARHAATDSDMSMEEIDDRLHALKACARKHQVEVNALPAVFERLQAEEQGAATSTEHLAQLEQAAATARTTFESACQNLSAARTACLDNLHQQLHAALAHLHMPHARVEVRLAALPTDQWNADGAEAITFLLAANPGQPAQPIARVASGGELSRLMLALKTVFYAALPPRTVVLDEIDTGLSGAAAHAVGEAMARLAEKHQLVAITHHAQVAAHAAHHWQVAKHTESGTTTTDVQVLTPATREDELARLLSGARITDAARAAAQALLQEPRHAA